DPPMGQADMHRLVSVMTGPAAFQLFQAGFDIAAAVDLVTDLPEEILCQKVTSRLRGRVDSSHGPGGLFFLQNELFTGVSANVSAELVLNNKLCRMCIEAGPQACERYYVPYTSPVGFKTTVSPKAKELCEQIRKRLYA